MAYYTRLHKSNYSSTVSTTKHRAKKVLELVQKCALRLLKYYTKFHPQKPGVLVLDGDDLERTVDSEDEEFFSWRKMASESESIVLLGNEG
jgi:hypothetical protein